MASHNRKKARALRAASIARAAAIPTGRGLGSNVGTWGDRGARFGGVGYESGGDSATFGNRYGPIEAGSTGMKEYITRRGL